MSNVRNKGIILVTILMGLQSIIRLIFTGIFVFGDIQQFLTVEVSPTILLLGVSMFFALGVTGLILCYGLWKTTAWGFWGTILHSVITILFDIWGITIQYTAFAGFPIPIILLIYLFLNRLEFLEEK
ncbi:MAG: hypothetical protein ACFFBD_12905 [Candidatus Hodarchaeota archaeon]